MADVEVVLLYKPSGFEGEGEFRLCRTSAAAAIQAVAAAAIEQARATVALYRGLDPGLERVTAAEADRLETVLHKLIPSYTPPAEPGRPRLVPPPSGGKP